MEVQKIPAMSGRPETGPMQFDGDWPGVFIRGDNALQFAMVIEMALQSVPPDWISAMQLKGLAKTLRSCSVGNTGWPPGAHTAA